jgi:hypothetical protein
VGGWGAVSIRQFVADQESFDRERCVG